MTDVNIRVILAFTDLVSDELCGLVFEDSDSLALAGVQHPRCSDLADLSIELDAFYCPACRYSGRVSGAWTAEVLQAAKNAEETCENRRGTI